MKTTFKVLILISTCWLAGCVIPSLNPLFTERQSITYPAIVGSWTQDDGKQTWTFAASTNNTYKVTQTDEDHHVAIFDVRIGKLGTNIFFDSFIDDPKFEDRINNLAILHLAGVHLITKVSNDGDALHLTWLDVEWMNGELKKNPKLIPHVMQSERAILTASTEELQKFVTQYAADTNAFKNEIKLMRKK